MIPVRNIRRFLRKAIEQPFYAIKVGYKRLKADLYYRFSDGKAPLPESLTLFLTHRCNLHCKMCGQWGDFGITKLVKKDNIMQELSIDELKKFIDDINCFKPNITLFGGEPFIYREIMSLIEYIKHKKLHCLVITNGSMLKDFAENIVKIGLDELNISLDGDMKTHDTIRGMKGLFNRISKGIEEVNFYKEKYKTKKPLINLQCTINKDNYTKIEQMIEVAGKLKVNSLTYHHLIFLAPLTYEKQEKVLNKLLPKTSSSNWKGFIFEPGIDQNLLINKINDIKKIKTDFFVNFYPNFTDNEILDYYKNPDYLPQTYKPRCISPWIVNYIFPDGTVKPCLNLDYSFGNIKELDFKKILNSETAIKYRRILKKQKIFPACIRCTELFRY